jgi:hypothetical protein
VEAGVRDFKPEVSNRFATKQSHVSVMRPFRRVANRRKAQSLTTLYGNDMKM